MRMRKIDEAKEAITLEVAIKDFIGVKRAQMLGAETMRDYEAQLNRFLHSSRNSTDYIKLEQDTLNFFHSNRLIRNMLPNMIQNHIIEKIVPIRNIQNISNMHSTPDLYIYTVIITVYI